MEKRYGIVGIIVDKRRDAAPKVNDILSNYGELIVGRLGLPCREKGFSFIVVVIEADTDELGAMTGKLGMLPDIKVKSLMI